MATRRATKAMKHASSSSRSTRRTRSSATGPTRDQLYEQARRRGIRGRSKMTKAQLQRALSR